MAERDDLVERLEALGAADPPALDESRRAALEARVMAGTLPARRSRASRRTAPVVMAVAAATALIVAGVLLARGTGTTEIELARGAIVVELPDGTVVDGTVGVELPDGTVVEIAARASARIAGTELGPGRYAIVDGRARAIGAVAPASSTAVTQTGPTSGPTIPSATTTIATPPATTASGATDRPRSATTTTDVPPETRPVDPVTTTRDRATTTTHEPTRDDPRPTTTTARPPGDPTTTAPVRDDVTRRTTTTTAPRDRTP